MPEITIFNFSDENLRNKTLPVLEEWSRKGFLTNFLTLENFDLEKNQYQSFECIGGEYRSIEDIKTRLESVQYEKIRMVNITSPISQPPDFPGIQKYLRAPANISLIFLNLIVPLTSWYENKTISSGTTFANANILISPVDRSNPLRIPKDIEEENYYHHISANAVITGSIWRGMEKGPFDEQKRNQQGKIDFIVSRFFTRLLIGPDPVVGILDTLTNENGKWITPHQDYVRPSDDYIEVSRFSNLVIDNHSNLFNYESYENSKTQKKKSFLDFFRNRYSAVTFSEPLPMLSQMVDSTDILNDLVSGDTTPEGLSNDTEHLDSINEVNKELFRELSGRGNNKQPKLWREIRQIIFSFIDGSPLPIGYGENKEKIVLNNPKSIVSNEIDLNIKQDYFKDEDNTESLFDVSVNNESEHNSEKTFFGSFIKYIQTQISLALSEYKQAFIKISNLENPDSAVIDKHNAMSRRLKILDKVLILYLLNIILYIVNYLLVNGGYVDILIRIPSFDSITPSGIIVLSILLLSLWVYWLYNLYLLNNELNAGDEDTLSNLLHSAKKLNELTFLIKQFEIWSIIFSKLIHKAFDYDDADLNIDDSYVDFSPLASIKGEVGSLSMEIIKDIQNSIIKVGWFREIYKLIESDFETYSQTKIMRPNEEILSLVDEEDTNKDDTDSTRFYFLEFFEKGLGQSTMREYFQKNIEEVMKNKGSEELFHETLSNGNNLQDFLNEVNRTEERAEKEFDPSIWSTVSRVFQMRAVSNIQDDDIDSTEYSIKAGSPIQRVIIRTDQSERIGITDFQDEPNGNSDDDDASDEPTQNPDDY